MLLYLINPYNPLVSVAKKKLNRWNSYSVWKPLGLLVLAGLTPKEWDVTVFDENVERLDYSKLPAPDLVGITAFTSQASRAYAIAREFRARKVPVVMGGIHATMCTTEASSHVDVVVTGEAESVWGEVLEDCKSKYLQPVYNGVHIEIEKAPIARHDLLPYGYRFGSIQTTRGCPLSCNFCSVTAFNGRHYRHRAIEQVISEYKEIREKWVLFVDDNLIGTRKEHIAHAKDLMRAIIASKVRKKWIAQVTLNFGDDDELLTLAVKAGCVGVFIGFESISTAGLEEIHKKFNIRKGNDIKKATRNIQKRGIAVVGSFIIGLDIDKKGIGTDIATTAQQYGLDAINLMILTPLPGTILWKEMEAANRIVLNNFPDDWKYYTLTFPVARYNHLTWSQMTAEKEECYLSFYDYGRIFKRVLDSILQLRNPFVTLISSMWYRTNTLKLDRATFMHFDMTPGDITMDSLAGDTKKS